MIVAREGRAILAKGLSEDTVVVATPLELISRLEAASHQISTVVLAGDRAANRELATFLLDTYRSVHVVDEDEPAFA